MLVQQGQAQGSGGSGGRGEIGAMRLEAPQRQVIALLGGDVIGECGRVALPCRHLPCDLAVVQRGRVVLRRCIRRCVKRGLARETVGQHRVQDERCAVAIAAHLRAVSVHRMAAIGNHGRAISIANGAGAAVVAASLLAHLLAVEVAKGPKDDVALVCEHCEGVCVGGVRCCCCTQVRITKR